MLDVQRIVCDIPEFSRFTSQEELETLVMGLNDDPRFDISAAGASRQGRPIYHVRFGTGRIKALVVAFPHCMEPIGGMTVSALLTLLKAGQSDLVGADVAWHIIPSIDPDGGRLNEVWSQAKVDLINLRKNFYAQAPRDQVDMSFPVNHKRLQWDTPSHEASILKTVLDDVRPDFFYSLHNAWTGGAFYFLSHDLGRSCYSHMYQFLESQDFPLAHRPIWREFCAQFSNGFAEMFAIRKHYDYLEKSSDTPEQFFRWGATSFEYLASIKPEAVSFVSEMGYVRHPDDDSHAPTGENLRKFKLQLDAENKYLATVLLEEWEAVKDEVDQENPRYRTIFGGTVLPDRERLHEGGRPIGRYTTKDLLLNPEYNREMTAGDRFEACFDGAFFFHLFSYQLVQLLKASPRTPRIDQAITRLEQAYDAAQIEINRHVDPTKFRTVDCTTLARVQLGSGLVILNSLLEEPQ